MQSGLSKIGELIIHGPLEGLSHVALVTDSNVGPLYAQTIRDSLHAQGIAVDDICIPAGEQSKTLDTARELWDKFAHVGLKRTDAVLALGGGMVGDVAGFAAATWMRGTPLISVPTTLLAMVDASLGGKVAIDVPAGKNLVGTFWEPAMHIVDTSVLSTLPPREFTAGMAEVVKTALITSRDWSQELLENALAHTVLNNLPEIVQRTSEAKMNLVAQDPLDNQGIRAALNYGHTVGHALEAACGYEALLHGEAVALGMQVAGALSVRQAGLSPEDFALQTELLSACALSPEALGCELLPHGAIRIGRRTISADEQLVYMRSDKKANAQASYSGLLNFVLLQAVGKPLVCAVSESELQA